MIVLVAPLSGRVVGRRGPRLPLVIAGVCFAVACAMLTGIGPDTRARLAARGLRRLRPGLRLVNAPITNTAVSGMPRAQAGVAAAIATTSRQVGADARRRGGRGDRRVERRRGGDGGLVRGEPPGVVDAHGLRRRRAPARRCMATTHARQGVGAAHGGRAQPGSAGCIGDARGETPPARSGCSCPTSCSTTSAAAQVSDALGMSFGRARAVRRLARGPMSMRELADVLGIDPPNATDARRRHGGPGPRAPPRPTPPTGARSSSRRRARARTKARRADEILATPPPRARGLSGDELETLHRILTDMSVDS